MKYDDSHYIKPKEFAKICGVNKQTLLFYDSIKLFSPSFTDEKGYRYYTYSQFDIFSTILALKAMGLSLDEIKNYIYQRTADSTASVMGIRIAETSKNIAQLETLSANLKTKISLIKKAEKIKCGMIYIEYREKQLIKCSDPMSNSSTDKDRHTCLGSHIAYRMMNQLHCGHAVGGMVSRYNLFHFTGHPTRYEYYYTAIDSPLDSETYQSRPAGNYLVLYHRGHYNTTWRSYPKIIAYAETNQFELGDYVYEESLIDEVSESDPDNYITEICIPILFSGSLDLDH